VSMSVTPASLARAGIPGWTGGVRYRSAVARQCERPGCAEPATVGYGFDPRRQVAWLESVVAGGGAASLCRRHADAMAVPRGWWLDDRRQEQPREVRARPAAHEPAPTLFDASSPAVEAAPDESDDSTPAWSPIAVARTDLVEVLDATTPLLARAFGRARGRGDPAAGAAAG
jgi:Protein of unknown function (DUF3499)